MDLASTVKDLNLCVEEYLAYVQSFSGRENIVEKVKQLLNLCKQAYAAELSSCSQILSSMIRINTQLQFDAEDFHQAQNYKSNVQLAQAIAERLSIFGQNLRQVTTMSTPQSAVDKVLSAKAQSDVATKALTVDEKFNQIQRKITDRDNQFMVQLKQLQQQIVELSVTSMDALEQEQKQLQMADVDTHNAHVDARTKLNLIRQDTAKITMQSQEIEQKASDMTSSSKLLQNQQDSLAKKIQALYNTNAQAQLENKPDVEGLVQIVKNVKKIYAESEKVLQNVEEKLKAAVYTGQQQPVSGMFTKQGQPATAIRMLGDVMNESTSSDARKVGRKDPSGLYD